MTEPYKWVSTGYAPRKHQVELHRKVKRFSCIVAHRRFGKGVWSANEIIDRALRLGLPNPKYCHISPYISQAKRNMWDVFKHYTRALPGVKANENELKIEIPRPTGDTIRIQLFGGDDPDAIRGQYFDGVVLDESAQIHPDVWKQGVRPALSDRLGWCAFIGTPKGKNFFYHVHLKFRELMNQGNPDYYTEVFKSSETGIIPASELLDAKNTMEEADYQQEYECSFESANVGSYYGKLIAKLEQEGKITEVPYDPATPVVTGWDLGIDDTTVIWFIQIVGAQVRVIDYVEHNGEGMPYFAGLLKERGYVYDRHIFPHDVKVRELGTGKTRKETFEKFGIRPIDVAPKLTLPDGIDSVRKILPRCVFDAKKCLRGIEALREYQRIWDSQKLTFEERPYHNWASNGADAFRTFAVGVRENRTDHSRLPREAVSEYDYFK